MGARMKRRQRQEFDLGELPMHQHADDMMSRPTQTPRPRRQEPFRPYRGPQEQYAAHIRSKLLTIGAGCAGTGKTYVSVAIACEMLRAGEIEKIIVTRPAVEAEGEQLGFLPGVIAEKFSPYFAPVLDILIERLGASFVQYAMKEGVDKIVAKPLAFMRGTTFKNAFVILDEAQNTTPGQMKMFLTRIGENTKVVVEGDEAQTDIPGLNGLTDAISKFGKHHDVGITTFDVKDVVRSGFVKDVLLAYRKAVPEPEPEEDIGLPDSIMAILRPG